MTRVRLTPPGRRRQRTDNGLRRRYDGLTAVCPGSLCLLSTSLTVATQSGTSTISAGQRKPVISDPLIISIRCLAMISTFKWQRGEEKTDVASRRQGHRGRGGEGGPSSPEDKSRRRLVTVAASHRQGNKSAFWSRPGRTEIIILFW